MQRSSPAIKKILSPAMRRQMKAIQAQTHFLLLSRPGMAIVDFIAVADSNQSSLAGIVQARNAMGHAFQIKREQIAALGPDYLRGLSDSGQLFRLCYEIVTEAQRLVAETKLTDEYIHAVAVEWLEEEPLPLGDAPIAPGETADPWRLTPANQAHLRFQDAVDWYAKYDCSLTAAQLREAGSRFAGYEGVGGESKNIVLKVPTPASRDRIVSLSNLKLFVAEHLLAYNRYAAGPQGEEDDKPELTFFFLPIKGLGQVRAAINWVGVNIRGSTENIHRMLSAQATELQRSALESLFTQSLIRSFGIALREALRETRADESNDHFSLHHAFAELWWASEVRFYNNGEFQISLVRAEDATATTWNTSTTEPPGCPADGKANKTSDFVSISGERHPGLSFIRLNLSALFEHSKHCDTVQQQLAAAVLSQKDLEKTFRSIPFDDVVFACHFFQPESQDIDEWKGQLAETAISALIDQTIQHTSIVRSKTKALEGVAHWLNSLVRMAGRARAARTVKGLLKNLKPGDRLREPLQQVLDSLQLLTLLEAGTSVLRVSGAVGEGDPGRKLTDWFTPTSLAEWNLPETFEKYERSLTHLVRAISSSFGHPTVLVSYSGEEKLYTERCELEIDELLFPPLSKAEKGNEPILALLPALTEPIANALTYMKTRGLLGTSCPIILIIEDRRHDEVPSINVEIGSPYFEGDHLPSSHGLVIASRVSALTGLARIGEGTVRLIDDRPYYFVPVSLHPQMLAERLEKTYDDSTEKTKAAHHR